MATLLLCTCPSDEELAQSLCGELPVDHSDRLAQHLETCSECARKIEQLSVVPDMEDLLVSSHHELHQPFPRELANLMDRLRWFGSGAVSMTDSTPSFPRSSPDPDGRGRLGPYRLLRELPPTGSALVYEAEDPQLRRNVWLKVLRPDLAENVDQRQLFLETARALAAVKHRYVVTVYEVADVQPLPYVVMEVVSDGALSDWLKGFVPAVPETLRITREVAEALLATEAHGLQPAELAPDQIWLQRAQHGELSLSVQSCVKLRDFELAPRSTPTVRSHGTAQQQLGGVLYSLLTGRWLAVSDRAAALGNRGAVRTLNPHVPSRVARFVEQLLEPTSQSISLTSIIQQLKKLERTAQTGTSTERIIAIAATIVAAALSIVVATQWNTSRPLENSSTTNTPIVPAPVTQTAEPPKPAAVVEATTAKPVPAAREPLSDAWLKLIERVPPEVQVESVVAELQRRNPRYDGKYRVSIENGVVRDFGVYTDSVRDISPVRAFSGLERFHCHGSMPGSGVLEDLSPLKGLKLVRLDCGWTRIRDLTPLAGMPLTILGCGGTRIESLEPLRSCPLQELHIWSTRVVDLSPLSEMRTLTVLNLQINAISNLEPLATLPLKKLRCEEIPVADWSVLQSMPLESIQLTYHKQRHRDLLLAIPTLKEINGQPAADVLK